MKIFLQSGSNFNLPVIQAYPQGLEAMVNSCFKNRHHSPRLDSLKHDHWALDYLSHHEE